MDPNAQNPVDPNQPQVPASDPTVPAEPVTPVTPPAEPVGEPTPAPEVPATPPVEGPADTGNPGGTVPPAPAA